MEDGALDKVGRALLQLRHDRQQRRVRGERLHRLQRAPVPEQLDSIDVSTTAR